MTYKEFNALYKKDYTYCYQLMRQHKVIEAKNPRNWITYVNENRVRPNVALKSRHCYAILDIQEGEELVLDYGYNYPRDY